MIGKIFGAYDVRGRYPRELNEETVHLIANALVRYFQKTKPLNRRKIVVLGRDARTSSPSLYGVLVQVFRKSKDFRLVDAGLTTTPMLYFLVGRFRATLGVMVTASHNPKSWNGLKVVGRGAKPISGREVGRMLKT